MLLVLPQKTGLRVSFSFSIPFKYLSSHLLIWGRISLAAMRTKSGFLPDKHPLDGDIPRSLTQYGKSRIPLGALVCVCVFGGRLIRHGDLGCYHTIRFLKHKEKHISRIFISKLTLALKRNLTVTKGVWYLHLLRAQRGISEHLSRSSFRPCNSKILPPRIWKPVVPNRIWSPYSLPSILPDCFCCLAFLSSIVLNKFWLEAFCVCNCLHICKVLIVLGE